MNDHPMKITICSHDGKDYFGGPYEWIKRLGPELREAGAEVSFLFFSDHKEEESSTFQYLVQQGFVCRLLPQHSFTQFHDHTEGRVDWCLRQVKQLHPDVFIANASLPALYAGKWIKASGIPVIGVLHTDDARYQWMEDVFVNGEDAFRLSALVCVSQGLKSKLRISNQLPLPVEVISCGTPIGEGKARFDHDALRLVYAGKLTEDAKQISKLTQAFCRAAREIEGVEAYLYGEGPSKETVLKILSEEGKGLPVHYKGFVTSTHIQEELLDKQVVVLLSDYEGLPIVLLEAMACGLVPVCLNISSGIPELVLPDETGLLVNDRGEEFVAAIRRLRHNRELWQKLSHGSLELVRQEHAMSVVTNRWLALCRACLPARKERLKIPSRIVLPPVHPLLRSQDQRKKTLTGYLREQFRRVTHRIIGGRYAV